MEAEKISRAVSNIGFIVLMPKFSMRMAIQSEFNRIEWYGRDPFENYIDHKDAVFLGSFDMQLHEFEVPYAAPQDNGNRTDTRWIHCRKSRGESLRVKGLQPLSFRAWP